LNFTSTPSTCFRNGTGREHFLGRFKNVFQPP
jgi:hypothetical protein